MVNRDIVPSLRRVREMFIDGIVDLEFFTLLQDEDRCRSKLLGDRSQSEFCLCSIWNLVLNICQSIPLRQQDLSILGDQNRTAELFVLCGSIHVVSKLCVVFISAQLQYA